MKSMKKHLIVIWAALLVCLPACAQKKFSVYGVGFYNLENLFDQIIMTPNLLNQNGKKDFSTLKFWKPEIFRRDYLFQKEGRFKGNTKRTHAGGVWLDGYSDHLPVCVYLVKEQP